MERDAKRLLVVICALLQSEIYCRVYELGIMETHVRSLDSEKRSPCAYKMNYVVWVS
jgi:hypothetical protein